MEFFRLLGTFVFIFLVVYGTSETTTADAADPAQVQRNITYDSNTNSTSKWDMKSSINFMLLFWPLLAIITIYIFSSNLRATSTRTLNNSESLRCEAGADSQIVLSPNSQKQDLEYACTLAMRNIRTDEGVMVNLRDSLNVLLNEVEQETAALKAQHDQYSKDLKIVDLQREGILENIRSIENRRVELLSSITSVKNMSSQLETRQRSKSAEEANLRGLRKKLEDLNQRTNAV